MRDIPRLLPLWLILMLLILFVMCSCRTGGSWINPGSAGTIIEGKTPEQMNEEARAKRFQNAHLPAQSPQSIPPPTRSKPKDTTAQSVEPTEVVETPSAAGEVTPFEPTVSTEPAKLPPVKIKTKLPPKIIEGGCVITTDCGYDPEIAGPCEAAPEEDKTAATNWVNLFSLFVMLLLAVIGFWVVYDIIKDSIKMKKQGAPIKDHLENLKKPAKGTRASRKKATSKKKTTRKKKS